MAYEEQLAARIRALVGDRPELTEMRMFGDAALGEWVERGTGYAGSLPPK